MCKHAPKCCIWCNWERRLPYIGQGPFDHPLLCAHNERTVLHAKSLRKKHSRTLIKYPFNTLESRPEKILSIYCLFYVFAKVGPDVYGTLCQ